MALIMSMGGGAPRSTNLWTNSSPTSNFTDTSISLSGDTTNYDLVEFKYCSGKSHTTDVCTIYMTPSYNNTSSSARLNIQGNNGGSVWSNRTIYAVNDTTISISAVAGSSPDAGACIPLEVNGIKF